MDLDRLTPAQRKECASGPFAFLRRTGVQAWRDLAFVHYEAPAAALQRLLPAGVTVDTFEGRAYVGLVPFTMEDVRVPPLALVPLGRFLETNVRTYVHAGGVPGVWFLSLDAESGLAVWGGRSFFGLPYYRARMAHDVGPRAVDYRLERPARVQNASSGDGGAALDVRWSITDDAPFAAAPGTLAHFLTERYALYGAHGGNRGTPYRLRVHHAPWPLRRARLERLSTSLLTAAGVTVKDPIDLVLASPAGVAVETFAKERVPG